MAKSRELIVPAINGRGTPYVRARVVLDVSTEGGVYGNSTSKTAEVIERVGRLLAAAREEGHITLRTVVLLPRD